MKKLVLISGISGAGKTTASNVLEDMGYTCIDQYPIELLEDLMELINTSESIKYQKVALTIGLLDLEKFYAYFSNFEIDMDLILIDANRETVINRYKFSRRVHPLVVSNIVSSIEEAVEIEKNIIANFEDTSAHIIDTSNLSIAQLKEILDSILDYNPHNNLAVTFESFGFKNGVPDDADVVFDVRILKNPFYVAELKPQTGNDQPVRDYVLNSKTTEAYLEKLVSYLDFYFESCNRKEKRHIMVCIGCTGGQHRSVTVANYLYEHYREKYMCYRKHRELK
ncbi:MAG: RNase adapter RapZ [Erysipelotrichaceae bacterium]|nr:RNase adapter RapZ [Erysipelotrichaceae bacterium]